MTDFVRCKRLNEAFSYVSDEYLDLVELERKPEKGNRKSFRAAIGAAAACICILLLPLGVLAARWFHIRDLIIADTAAISLSGYMDSPEAQALAEWDRFLEGYDTDQAILNQIGNEPVDGIREDWSFYGIYTHEMEEKLDEIAAKYGLKLHTECNVINQDELMKRVGGCFMDKESLTWAYMYEDGYFHVEGDIKLSESKTAEIQLTRCVKGTFNNVILSVDEAEEFTEWQYISDSGEPVLLALTPYKALIFADFEDCFVSVNVLGGSESGMTKEYLQALADTIDFSILKDVQVPKMSGDSVVLNELMYGNVGETLGLGALVYTIPQSSEEDYKLYFFASKNEDERYLSFSERNLELTEATYIFPDAREGNIPIGKFQGFYYFDNTGDISGDGAADLLLIARYEVGDEVYYDTRVYVEKEDGYALDNTLTQKLNEKYYNVEEYPVWEVVELPHD